MNCSENRKRVNVNSIVRKTAEIASDILWPKKCIVCNCLVSIGCPEAICNDCISRLKKNSAVFIEPDRHFEEAICALPYSDNVRMSMIKFKFRSKKYLGCAFVRALYEILKDRDFIKDYNLICPVPVHPMRDREYNQSLVLAQGISERFNIELCPDLLIKLKNVTPLSTMGYAMRKVSVRGAVDFNVKYDIFNKNILLLDDIYTTGSTADECSKILKMHGAAKVKVIAACHRELEGENHYADANNFTF